MLKGMSIPASLSFTEAETDRRCSLGGYLWKMKNKKSSSFVPSWTRRWFSIEGPELKWYATQHAAEASGQVYLKFVNRVSLVQYENGVHSFTVDSSSGQRSLLLKADTRSVLDMWCRAIQMHADLNKGGDGTSLVTESAVSLNLRAQKRDTLEDRLETTERQLYKMENEINQVNQGPWKVAGRECGSSREHRSERQSDSKQSSGSREQSFSSVESGTSKVDDAGAKCKLGDDFWRRHRAQSMDDWLEQETEESEGKEDTWMDDSHSDEKDEGSGSRSRRKYSVSSLLSRKHRKIHV